jgi:plasmid maintenance system antidote protein VapI
MTCKQLAEKTGVSFMTIGKIVNGSSQLTKAGTSVTLAK